MTLEFAVTALVTLLAVHALVKFAFFFVFSYERRRALLDRMYGEKPSGSKNTDRGYIALVLVLAGLLFWRGADPVVLMGGIWIGSTLITVYFHRFDEQPDPSRAPPPAISPIKTMSYAIQDKPRKAWLELAIFTVLTVTLISLIWGRHLA